MTVATGNWVRSSADKRAVANGCTFDPDAGERVCEFMATFLKHSKGEWAGKPFVPMDWQRNDIIMPLFGWKRANGTRRYRHAYIEVPKKNGKSTMSAAFVLYMLIGDGEAGSEVYGVAADVKQAGIIFTEVVNMIESSPELSACLSINRTTKRITHAQSRSWYQVLSSAPETAEGLNVHGLVFDELHAQKSRRLWDTLMYGGAARRQPLQIAITTAGFDRHSICYEQHDYAAKVRDGIIEDDSFFQYIRAAPEDADWTDPQVWKDANPSYGVTVKVDQFVEDCKKAQDSPAKENTFRRYRLNQWTEQDVRWLAMDKWDACGAAFDPESLRGKECFAGLDLSTTTDLSAFVLVFKDDSVFSVLSFFWVPSDNAAKRAQRDRVPYPQWISEGYISATEGNVVDYDVIRREIGELGELYNIQEIAIDRWNSTQLQTQLMGDGFDVVPFGQGFGSMTAPTKELEKLVLSDKLRHGGHPVLRWCASNVSVKTDAAGNWKPDKEKSTERIDGIVALIMALGRVLIKPEQAASVYETRGLVTL